MKPLIYIKNTIPPQELKWITAALNDKRTAMCWLFLAISALTALPFLKALQLSPCIVLFPLLGVIDARTRHLPNSLTLPLFLTGILLSPYAPPFIALLSGMVMAGIFFGIQYAFHRLTAKQGMGMGDVKLIAGLAAWVGPMGILPMVLAACASALVYIAVTRTPKNARIPFGPFLLIGAWLAIMYQIPFWLTLFKLMGTPLGGPV